MMDVVVVYESMFGNSRLIAESIADGIRGSDPLARVTVAAVAAATPELIDAAALVVAGGPTHMLGLSRPKSRAQGVTGAASATVTEHAPVVEPGAAGPGIRDWLAALPTRSTTGYAAAFDTRLSFPLAGGAAAKIGRGLRRHGYRLVGKPTGFIVEGSYGPLRAGERDRATAWGAGLARQIRDTVVG